MKFGPISTALPRYEYTTDEMLNIFGCCLSDEVQKNIRRLGVDSRRLAFPLEDEKDTSLAGEAVCEVATEAGRLCLQSAQLKPADINYLIAASDESDYLCPGLSHQLISSLNLSPYTPHANLQGMACSAFPKAIEVASDRLTRYPRENVLVVASGVNSKWFAARLPYLENVIGPSEIKAISDPKDRDREVGKWLTAIQGFLFGDGAAATLVSSDPPSQTTFEVSAASSVTNLSQPDQKAGFVELGNYEDASLIELWSLMDRRIPELGLLYSQEVLRKLQTKTSDVDFKSVYKWAVHTGSVRILEQIAERFAIESEKMTESFETLSKHGNLAGASLPFILEKIASRRLEKQDSLVVALGFGWGFSADALLLRMVQ